MTHLISTDDLSNDEILNIFDDARLFEDSKSCSLLSDKLIITVFFENSTRTRCSFEIAAKRLGAKVVNLEVNQSSTKKGETVEDTIQNLSAMKPDALIIRHSQCGLPKSLIELVDCPIINAGDGKNEHPTQALLDLFTIMKHFDGDINGKKIAFNGDIINSRVASSNLKLLPRFGLDVTLVAPEIFMPKQTKHKTANKLIDIIANIDIVYGLRIQLERDNTISKEDCEDFAKEYCITKDIIAQNEIILLHPGPVNRNIDISNEMLKDDRCLVLDQVSNGIAVRMAILKKLIYKGY